MAGSQVDHTDVGQSVEHQLHPERGQQETEYLLGDQHPARVQLAADLYCPAETAMSNASTAISTPTPTASTAIELASADKVTRTTIPAGLSR